LSTFISLEDWRAGRSGNLFFFPANAATAEALTLLSENGLVKGEYTLDLLHLNAAGYEALNQSLAPLLTDLAQTRASG
jgi:hypothetical protein